jgi:hypothetical protein
MTHFSSVKTQKQNVKVLNRKGFFFCDRDEKEMSELKVKLFLIERIHKNKVVPVLK